MLDRLSILRHLFPGKMRDHARPVVHRWRTAFRADPDMARDLVGMALMTALQPRDLATGATDLTPQRLAYEAGRRDLALELLALAGATNDDFLKLMENDRHDDPFQD